MGITGPLFFRGKAILKESSMQLNSEDDACFFSSLCRYGYTVSFIGNNFLHENGSSKWGTIFIIN